MRARPLDRAAAPVFYQCMLTSAGPDVGVLRALADPGRLAIIQALATEQLCTCHLVELTGLRQTNVSNHLRLLREAGLVEAEPYGRFTYYRLVPEQLAALGSDLTALTRRSRTAARVKRPCA